LSFEMQRNLKVEARFEGEVEVAAVGVGRAS
jgi:hypothetical protein